MRLLSTYLFILFAMIAFFSVGSAQENVETGSPTVTVRFMSWERSLQGLYTKRGEMEFHPVHAPAYNFGRDSKISQQDKFQLFQKTSQDGEEVFIVVGEANLPKGASEVRAYLVPKQKDTNGNLFHIILMADDRELFSGGEVRIFNFSPNVVGVKLGEAQFSMDPLEWKQLTPEPDHKFRVLLGMSMKVDGEWSKPRVKVLSLRPDYRGEVTIVHTTTTVGDSEGTSSRKPYPRAIMETRYVPQKSLEISKTVVR